MQIKPVSPQTLVDKVCKQLAELIVEDGGEDVGEQRRLPSERRLSDELGVSRQVVRESIKRLELQGLLEVRQGIGTCIVDRLHRPLTDSLLLLISDVTERLKQLTEFRLAVEPAAAALAAKCRSDSQVEVLWAIHKRLVMAKNDEDAIAVDMEFHQAIATISGNQIFSLVLNSMGDILIEGHERGYRQVRECGGDGLKITVEQHESIMRAIESGDEIEAAESMRRHLCNSRERLWLKSGDPLYFNK